MNIAIAVIIILVAVIVAQAHQSGIVLKINEYLRKLIRAHTDNTTEIVDRIEELEARNAYLESYFDEHQAILAKHSPNLVQSIDEP